VSFVTTRVFSMEINKDERIKLSTYDWQLVDIQGNKVDFNTFKNKVIVVNFWATWCPPCIAEMPAFEKLYQDYKKDVVFLFVANDDPKKVKKFISAKGYSHPVYYQLTEAPKDLLSNSLPTTYIINKGGEIVVDKTGAADWNSGKVRDLLDTLIK
ncbi:MAG: TlpA family protein disulfide reductase, partial [Flavobacteriaceae bacterium]|nr:TlpA family protein disulfide reductase [Flavobacteriaceae bacterium]